LGLYALLPNLISVVKLFSPKNNFKALHRKISETSGNYTGNHCIALLRTVYNYAIKEERFEGRNPANAVHMNKKEPRVRYKDFIF